MFKPFEQEFKSKYISCGIHKNLTISDLKWVEDEEGRQKMEITLENEEGQTLTDQFVYTEKSKKYFESKVTHMWTCFYDVNQLAEIGEKCGEDMALFTETIAKYLVGKTFSEFKVIGEEIQGKDGKANWIKGRIGLPNFANGPLKNRELSFDPSNQYDLKKLPASPPAVASTEKRSWR